jgi:glycosyltransferase involved in cell wall biosynthesis
MFKENGWEFIVRSDKLQKQNPHPLKFNFKEIPFNFSQYKKEIININPDIVIVFLHLKNFITWQLVHWLKLKKIPIVYWNKGINLEVPNPFIRNQFFYYIHNICDRIILYSSQEVEYIKMKNRHKISIANNTLNYEDFPDIKESKEEIKTEFGIPFEKVVLFVGRMREVKKVDHVIAVFHSIKNENVGLVIVGDDMHQNISEKINKRNTIYLGEIYDPEHVKISKLFKMADIFCIPGDVGLGLNQAFYWGLPVITEDGYQPPEIHYLINGRNGFIVPQDDLIKLKEKIMYLLENDKIRQKFSEDARYDILRNASINNMFMGFKHCVDSLSKLNNHSH